MSANFFESLETRRMLAASVSNGLLTVAGNDNANSITITQLSNGNVRVAEGSTISTFSSTSVQNILVNAGGGNDTVTIDTSVTRPATINGGSGNDTLVGSNQNDRIFGGSGNDVIFGRGGADFLHGGSGTDSVRGGDGNDSLYAGTGSGRDSLFGDAGNDILVALGGGQDSVIGGTGTDVFWVDKAIPGFLFDPGTPGDITDASTTERNLGAFHDIERFQQLKRVNVPILNEQTQQPSRELNSPNLLDPNPVSVLNPDTSSATFSDFSDRDLFTNGLPTFNDVNQGGVGNCYFQASIASIAQRNPAFLKRHVVDLGDGTYAVRFMGLLGPEYIRVDGDLPTVDGNLIYGGLGDNGTIWAAIMEKAWAFRRFGTGRYDTTTAGNPAEVYTHLGLLSTNVSLTGFSTTAMMNTIRDDLALGRAATATTKLLATQATSKVLPAHVYLIERVTLNASGAVTSLRLFNPHGIDNIPEGSTEDANPDDGLVTITPAQFMANFAAYNAAIV